MPAHDVTQYQTFPHPTLASLNQLKSQQQRHKKLREFTPRKGKFYLRTLEMTSTSGKDFPWGESGVFNWDVMEFAEQMKPDE